MSKKRRREIDDFNIHYSNPHTDAGIRRLKETLKIILVEKYCDIAQGMFTYDYGDDPRFEMMNEMSMKDVPERYLFRNGICCWFELKYNGTDNIFAMPLADNKYVNLYNQPSEWHACPESGLNTEIASLIHSLKLNNDNSVLMRNLRTRMNDLLAIDVYTDMMVSSCIVANNMTMNANTSYYFIANNKAQAKTAKKTMEDIANNANSIILTGAAPMPELLETNVKFDPAILEGHSFYDYMLMESLGIPCTDIHKRAQQSVSETNMNLDKVYLRLRNKYQQRQNAVDLINDKFDCDIELICTIDKNIGDKDINSMEEPSDMEGGSYDDGGMRNNR